MASTELLTCMLAGPLIRDHFWKDAASPLTEQVMDRCFEQAESALAEGSIPEAAALVDIASGREWYAVSDYETTGNILDHAALKCYRQAQPFVRDNLSSCELISTIEPCGMCVMPYLIGKLGSLVMGATRKQLVRENGSLILPRTPFDLGFQVKEVTSPIILMFGLGATRSIDLMHQWDQQRQTG